MKVLCIGQSKLDITIDIDKESTDGIYDIKNTVECGGGRASNVAYMLGKYKVDSYIASVVGDDTFGQIIKKELDAVGTHTEYMETAFGKRTMLSYIMNSKVDNKKKIYNISKDELSLKKTEFQIDPDVIYIDRFDYGAAIAGANIFSKKTIVFSADKYTSETMELCKYCTYMMASKEFAEAVSGLKFDLTNSQSLVSIYSALTHKFPNKIIIITIDEQGSMYMVDNQIKVMPSLNLEKKDNTDASIVFDGAFVYSLLQGFDLEKAITFANIASGLSVLKVGCRNSIPELSDIMTYFNQKYPKAN